MRIWIDFVMAASSIGNAAGPQKPKKGPLAWR
jgi:hypothetical protein